MGGEGKAEVKRWKRKGEEATDRERWGPLTNLSQCNKIKRSDEEKFTSNSMI